MRGVGVRDLNSQGGTSGQGHVDETLAAVVPSFHGGIELDDVDAAIASVDGKGGEIDVDQLWVGGLRGREIVEVLQNVLEIGGMVLVHVQDCRGFGGRGDMLGI